jgi:hypothetical protein
VLIDGRTVLKPDDTPNRQAQIHDKPSAPQGMGYAGLLLAALGTGGLFPVIRGWTPDWADGLKSRWN